SQCHWRSCGTAGLAGRSDTVMREMLAADALHRSLGLTDDELVAIERILGRAPNHLELAMYAVMWSEHCSYKSSRIHLKRLPSTGEWVLVGPGEGAGVIDVGDGIAAAIRIESHNHPSAIEPYQGAATGAGGILRDIFSVGARPIALMDPLRVGSLEDPRNRWLLEGIVSGISGYGNSVGVPTVGGEVVCDDTYAENPLVNVLCLGLLPTDRLVLATATGLGNLVVLMGSSTGRDGIGGASMASEELGDADDAKRPAVQVGDPFEEKRLIEACLTLLDAGLAVGVQDLGAAGITGATSETAGKGGEGVDIDVSTVPRREPGMQPWEVMISESQERMLAIVRPDDLDEVLAVCARWEVRAAVIGSVTGTGRYRIFDGDELVADFPARALSDAPAYDRPMAPRPAPRPAPAPPTDPAAALLGSLMDTSWVSSQYDSQLFLNTVAGPGSDAAVLRLKHPTTGVDTGRALALTTDGNHAWCAQDAFSGTARVVCEAVLNLACVGARPLALVNCLNFGNPEHPEVMRQLSDSIDGMAEACTAFGIPVVGGNVSLYNGSRGQDIDPTPVIGLLGMVDRLDQRPPGAVLVDGHRIVVIGEMHPGVAGGSPCHDLDLRAVSEVAGIVRQLVLDGVLSGVHDVADGGVAKALAEMAARSGVGARVAYADAFDESAGRVVVCVAPGVEVPGVEIGVAGGDRLVIADTVDLALADVVHAWRDTLPSAMQAAVTH
ncbi:MAG: phosphoribosylformylglycinamidine synthase subunit PurL, partial [Actinomycetota bacterium]|nr:phosphoribosylformylglycinamidine synthase subunit PurL [Actinomycetota bacterium]